jgi:hypothetical protein
LVDGSPEAQQRRGLAQNPLRTTRYGYDGSGRLSSEEVTDRT